jgi:hypothetical protein
MGTWSGGSCDAKWGPVGVPATGKRHEMTGLLGTEMACSRVDRAIAAGPKSRARNLAQGRGVAGSNPVVRSREVAGQGRCEPASSCFGSPNLPGVPSGGTASYMTSSRIGPA